MNILPKKRWHVRTKENIARVRKDEAEAAEKERKEKLRIETADREARLSVLKSKSKQHLQVAGVKESQVIEEQATGHVNLFSDFDYTIQTTNKDHDKETKEEKEKYEKKIGYLTYLGQDTNEALKKKNWYEVMPESSKSTQSEIIKDTYEKLVLKDADGKPKTKEIDEKNGEIAWKAKQFLDPLNDFKEYCPPKIELPKSVQYSLSTHIEDHASLIDNHVHNNKKEKKKKHKKDKYKEKMYKLQKMREARLKRELQEKQKTTQFLMGLHKPSSSSIEEQPVDGVRRKYNSQFNPSIARQNYR